MTLTLIGELAEIEKSTFASFDFLLLTRKSSEESKSFPVLFTSIIIIVILFPYIFLHQHKKRFYFGLD